MLLVTIAILCGISGVIIGAAATHPTPKAHEPRQHNPRNCSEFAVVYDEEDWNVVTETYPINHAWNDCMGVGHN